MVIPIIRSTKKESLLFRLRAITYTKTTDMANEIPETTFPLTRSSILLVGFIIAGAEYI